MEEMNTIEMQAQESAAGTAGYAESTAPAGPEAPQGDLGGTDNEGTGARRQTPEENARFAAMRRPKHHVGGICHGGGRKPGGIRIDDNEQRLVGQQLHRLL